MQCSVAPITKTDGLCLTQLVSLSLKHSRRTTEQIIRVGERGAKAGVKRKNKEGHFRAGITKEEEMFERKTQLYIMMLIFSLVSLIWTANILITKRPLLAKNKKVLVDWKCERKWLFVNTLSALLVSVTSLKSYWVQQWSLCKLWSDWSQKGCQLSNDHAASFSFICACGVWFQAWWQE